MSFTIPFLTPQQWEFVNSTLWLTPKRNFSGVTQHTAPLPSFPAFASTKDDQVMLPMMFGRLLFQVPPSPASNDRWKFTGTLRSHQIPVLEEAKGWLDSHGGVLLSCYCGFGKTISACKLSSGYITPYPDVVVHSLKLLLPQWIQSYQKVTTAHVAVNGAKNNPVNPDVWITMIEGIPKLIEKLGNEGHIGTLIIDECHLMCTELRLKLLLLLRPQRIILLSATPKKDNGLDSILELLAGPGKVVTVNPNPFQVFASRTNITPEYKLNKMGKVDFTVMSNWLADQPSRDLLALDWVIKNPRARIAILTNRVGHAERMAKLFEEAKQSITLLCGKHKEYKPARIIIGTGHKLGTGFDAESAASSSRSHARSATPHPQSAEDDGYVSDIEPELEEFLVSQPINMMIMMYTTKHPQQMVGRAFRSAAPCIVQLLDNGAIFDNHFKMNCAWYASCNGVISYSIPRDLSIPLLNDEGFEE
jgi:hypothetical protein